MIISPIYQKQPRFLDFDDSFFYKISISNFIGPDLLNPGQYYIKVEAGSF